MRLPAVCRFILVCTAALTVALVRIASAADPPAFPKSPPAPTPVAPTPTHVPYNPFERSEVLPVYPSQPSPARSEPQTLLAKPAGVDLDVTYISRTPMYNRYQVWYTPEGAPYLAPGTENDKRWPSPGEEVIFTAHFMNKGTAASGSFAFKWFVDGGEVSSGTHVSLAPGEAGAEAYRWTWGHTTNGERLLGSHAIRFVADPVNAIPETYESNNSLEDRTDALSLVLSLTPALYDALETPVDARWPFSAEDWLQKQIAGLNAAFARSIYGSTPQGANERVRLDKILVTSSSPPDDWTEDGGFFLQADDRQGDPTWDSATDISGALLHELSHQLGLIDLYNLDIALEIPQVLDRQGRPAQMWYWANDMFPGLMSNPGIRPPTYDEHTALALNANKGYRRGYYGEYLYDVPTQTYLRVLDNRGNPAAGVTVKLFQRSLGPNSYGSRHGTVDNTPEITGVTDANGLLLLLNRGVATSVSTRTGHVLRDNPFSTIDVVGRNDEFALDLSQGIHQEYTWLDIREMNLAAWRSGGGSATIEIRSHAPAGGAPLPPSNLSGDLEFGLVKLSWPASPSSGVASYNIYRTARGGFGYDRVATGVTSFSYSDPYDDAYPAITYAVSAVDNAGRESGFSNLFYAFRLYGPAAVAVDDRNGRFVLDPQNGYALLYQLSDGALADTRGSYDYHLENSAYLAGDGQGRLLISHPGDWYDSRHSVRVADQNGEPVMEFGARGSGAGQFETPAGVAAWGRPCAADGPYDVDGQTLLLLHFDDTYTGAQGEVGTPNGTTFASGRYSQGVTIDSSDMLSYPTEGNLNRTQGAIEFWLRPNWDGNDGQNRILFEVGTGWFNRMRITKDGANNLRLIMWDSTTEYGVAYNVDSWKSGEWHRVAATWDATNMAIYVDGQQRDSRSNARPPNLLAATMYIGSGAWGEARANATFDELRISSIPRVGNGETCNYRIIVADSGNHRLQAFDSEGNFVAAYGSFGSGSGRFNNPQGLAVDGAGRVIVADSNNNRLQVFGFDGTSFNWLRSVYVSFNNPLGVATYGASRIIVADTGNNLVKVLDENGNMVSQYSSPNDGRTGVFNGPRGVAVDRRWRIVVADTGNRRIVTLINALPQGFAAYLPLVTRSFGGGW